MDDGARLHVKVIGDDQGREKPLLIALHGAPGASTHLESEASFSFLRRTFRVLVYDARGSGDSDDRGPYSHDRWVKDLEILRCVSVRFTHTFQTPLTFNLRSWQQAEKFVLAGGSYGAFVALDYAITHGDRLHGLVVRAPWPNGVQGALNALANIMTSDRLTVDKARQVRNWSGTLRDNQDMQEALTEILPYFAPPEGAASREQAESTEFKGAAKFHFVAQNYAFSINMPPFDVRKQLTNIKVKTRPPCALLN